jgi:hypothetical protein
MQALAIVTCTLLGFATLLFGSDHLDRRLTVRAAQAAAGAAGSRAVAKTTAVIEATLVAEDAEPESSGPLEPAPVPYPALPAVAA